jgi:hypothetical protein
MLQTDCVTEAKVLADAITATKINVAALDRTTSIISNCDATADWIVSAGGFLSIDTNDKKEGTGSLKNTVAEPVIDTSYVTYYNPTGSWDWSNKKHILFWLKCDRPNTAFTSTYFTIYDTSGNWKTWLLTFSAGEWTAVKKLLSTGDSESETPPDLALIDYVRLTFKAADTTPFYKKIDNLRVTPSGVIASDHIIASMLQTDCVIEAKILDDAITAAKISVSGLDGTSGDVAADHIVAGMIQTNAITSIKILADAVTASKINVVGLDGTSGRIIVADVTDADEITGGINAHATTLIAPGKVLISGEVNLDDWSSATDATYIDGGKIYTDTITATQIDAGTITATELGSNCVTSIKILADAITASKINVVGLDGSTGRIIVADTTDADVVTGGINTHATTLIAPGKVLISGAVNLDNWSHASDATYIDGGDVYTNSITATQIAATTITASELAANCVTSVKILADAITASKINVVGLDGSTGRIIVADVTDANVVSGGINSYATTLIAPGKVLISGATVLSDWSHGTDATLIDGGEIYTSSITATQIAALTITAAEIASNAITGVKILADAITASKINVVGLDGATGRIVVTDQTDADEVTAGINTHAVTLINAGKILISGAVPLSDWSHATDATLIDGGEIYTNSIVMAKLDFVPYVIATDDLDDISDGTTYARVLNTDITAGHILLTACTGDLDDISDGSNYGKVALTSITAGKIIVAGLDSGVTGRMFTDSTTQTNIEAWKHASDVTMIDGGDIYADSITANQILAGTITASEIHADTITADNLSAGLKMEWTSTPTANARNSNNTEQTTVSASYVKLKEIKINEATGKINVYFGIHGTEGSPKDALGKVYKNGSPVGVEHSTFSTSYDYFEDEVPACVANDLIQIYVKKEGVGNTAYIANMALRYDRAVSLVVGQTLTTPLVTEDQTIYSVINQDPA